MLKARLVGASVLALLVAMPAYAADKADPSTPAAQGQDNAQDAPAVTGADIVVTATKRETTLQDTPIAVSVTTGATIEQAQIRDLIDIQTVVPSLRVSQLQSSANTNFIIRGFGNGANNAGIEPSVAVFIDGVYRSRSAAQIADLPNLKRVEVLRGPQSTLFGKNASAGVISIVTAEPSFNEYHGSGEFSFGNYNAIIARGDIGGPITDTLAFSVAANFNRRDGYFQNQTLDLDENSRNRYGFRGQLVFQPSADFKLRLLADYDRILENCCSVVNLVNGPTGAIVNALAPLGRGIIPATPFAYRGFTNFPSTNDITNYGFSAQADYTTGPIAVTSITAYREVGAITNQDSDFSGADLIGRNSANTSINTFTQELRLQSDFDFPVNFLVGGFYFNEKINQQNAITYGSQFRAYGDQLIRGATGNALNVALLENTFGALEGAPTRYTNTFFRQGDGLNERYRLANESISFFANADWKITDTLTFTAGFNYTSDRKTFSTNVVSTDVFSSVNFNAPAYAPFRNQLLFQGGVAQGVGQALGLGRSATAAEINAFAGANGAAFAQISAGAQAFANANQNNAAANPLNGLRGLQFLPPFFNVPNQFENGRTSDDDVSYTFRLNWKPIRQLSLYVTYATGFKASSINLSRDSRPSPAVLAQAVAAGIAPVNLTSGSRLAGPEKSTVIEGGIKLALKRFAANVAIFNQEISGFQSNVFSGTGFILANAPLQSTFGAEFDSTYTPWNPLTLNFQLTYLSPVYDNFPNGGAITPALVVGQANLTGTRPAGIPEISLSAGATYTRKITSGITLLLRGDYQYASPVQISEGVFGLEREVKSLNLSATAQLKGGFELTVWGRNVTDERYITTIFPSVAQQGSISGYPSQPATYGASVRYRF